MAMKYKKEGAGARGDLPKLWGLTVVEKAQRRKNEPAVGRDRVTQSSPV